MDIAQTKNLIQHIEQIAPQKLISSNKHPAVSANQVLSVAEMLLCAICQKTLDQPIQLSCDTLVCTGCVVQQLTASAQTFCPFPHQLMPETIKPASQMILSLLQDVLVRRMTCKQDVKAGDYSSHNCNSHDPKELYQVSTTLQHMLAEQSIIKLPTGKG